MPYADRTTLNNLTPNLDIGDVADPALRLAFFQYMVDLSDQNWEQLMTLVAGGTLQPYPFGVYRNALINSNFDFWQRGTSFSSPATGTYLADRWALSMNGSGQSHTISRQSFTVGQTDVPYEPRYFLRYLVGTAATSQTFNILVQRIESVRTFAGKTVTVSFYAKADAARNLQVEFDQLFGSGGSSAVFGTRSGNMNVTTAWKRFTYTVAIPSISGKTIGTADFLALNIFFPNNSTFTIDIAQVQVCAGDTDLPYQPRQAEEELALCQRYYEKSYNGDAAPGTVTDTGCVDWFSSGSNFDGATVFFKVKKRTNPTVTVYSPSTGTAAKIYNNSTSTDLNATTDKIGESSSKIALSNVSNSAGNRLRGHYTADAEF